MLIDPDTIHSLGPHTLEFRLIAGTMENGEFDPYRDSKEPVVRVPHQIWITGPEMSSDRIVCVQLKGWEEIRRLYRILRGFYDLSEA